MSKLYTLKFKPILKSIVWGGEKIAKYKNISTNIHNIGESWEISGLEGNESIVTNGEYAGESINSLVSKFKEDLVGKAVYNKTGDQFPLLIKFIDAHSDLSIQVHPNDEMAKSKHKGAKGKTEMWYVMDSDKDAHIFAGFKENLNKDSYVKRVEDKSISSAIQRYNVKNGDVFFLPAGTVHTICAGCFIVEIQQSSDITYRIYDYGRLGFDGKERELHTDLAKEAIDFTIHNDYKKEYSPISNKLNTLIDCPYFTSSLLELDKEFTQDLSQIDSFEILICLESEAIIQERGKEDIHIKQGETVLIPACCQAINIQPKGKVKLISCIIR